MRTGGWASRAAGQGSGPPLSLPLAEGEVIGTTLAFWARAAICPAAADPRRVGNTPFWTRKTVSSSACSARPPASS
jgi:hypothetical protein